MESEKQWFETWFDSKYYHILYQNRDDIEAKRFIDNLLQSLDLRADSRILDLACGKGRHSIYLSSKGFDVTGIDLSYESIEFANQYTSDKLHFYKHDMRQLYRIHFYDLILNLFTSFGYFKNEQEHLKVLGNIKRGLKAEGVFVMDFFNQAVAINGLVASETKSVQDINFNIERRVVNGRIEKSISFHDNGQSFKFVEQVMAFSLTQLENMFFKAGLKIQSVYGDYDLNNFDESVSPRLILVAQRND